MMYVEGFPTSPNSLLRACTASLRTCVRKTVHHGQLFELATVFAQPERDPHTTSPELAPNRNI